VPHDSGRISGVDCVHLLSSGGDCIDQTSPGVIFLFILIFLFQVPLDFGHI